MKDRKAIKIFLCFLLSVCLIFSSVSCSPEADYACSYFEELGIPEFDKPKMKGIESVYRDYYVEDIPSAKTLATATAKIYFDSFHDRIDTSDKEKVTDCLIYSYIEVIGDKYSAYRSAEESENYTADMSGKFYGIGVVVSYDYVAKTMTVNEVYKDGGAYNAGIMAGDVIVKIEGVSITEYDYQEAVYKIRGEIDTVVNLTVDRGGTLIDVSAKRGEVIEESVSYALYDGGIGYIAISSFKGNTFEQFKEAVDYLEENGAAAIIYDLRSNPGGYLTAVVDVLSYIAPKGATIVSFSNGYAPEEKDNNPHSVSLPSIVICNESTASAGELFTAAMRDFDDTFGYFDVTVIGEKTYGKGIMQNTLTFTDSSAITLTVAYYNPPSGKNYHGEGIVPDIKVEKSQTGDAQLSRALTEITKIINESGDK